jgi:hypothetical protein
MACHRDSFTFFNMHTAINSETDTDICFFFSKCQAEPTGLFPSGNQSITTADSGLETFGS